MNTPEDSDSARKHEACAKATWGWVGPARQAARSAAAHTDPGQAGQGRGVQHLRKTEREQQAQLWVGELGARVHPGA